ETTADADTPAVSLSVAEVTVCRKVTEDRAPFDAGEAFPADVGVLTCFTDVREAGTPQQIFHRWYLGDELVAEVPMQVKGARWRCWSQKEILPGWTGSGRVEIVNETGDVLGETAFVLVEPTAAPAAPAEPAATTGADKS
ncbi:MAG TPA: DUF2914 domain-containing protein, partial [bacterium]|nr:DUF2914 domain-containing protein [bacterium]